ncbi:MAG TPA: TonB-dependent receptor [Bryobacteraceae bacterium]|nr:TonB-dependent receptor [Bryobacteraceae bacterium]
MSRCTKWALVAIASVSACFAQSEVGGASLNGTVTDPTGAAVAGAKVVASNEETGFTRETITTEAGLYNFVRVPVGRYSLNIEASGFKGSRRENIALAVGAIATLDVALEIGTAAESVTVTAETPVVETTRSQTSTTVTEKAVRDLPINGRNFLDFATLTPGVVRDPRGGDLSFGGQRGPLNSLLIDGADANNVFFGQSAGRAGVRNPYSFSQESVREFQVNNNSFAPEVGRAGGGVINVITKSGTNDFHGNAFWFWRTTKLRANQSSNKFSPSARYPVGIPRQPYEYDQFGANVGGPVVKDKLFFFFNYEGQRNSEPVTHFLPNAPADAASQQAVRELAQYTEPNQRKQDNNIYLIKIDYNISPNQTLYGRYNRQRFDGVNFENTFQTHPSATGNSSNYTDNLTINYNRVIGSTMVWDARFNYLQDNAPGSANAEGPNVQVNQAGARYITYGRNNFSPRYTNINGFQGISTLSVVRGRHTLKFGGDLNFARVENFFPGQFGGTYFFASLADYASRRPTSFTQALAGADTGGPLSKPNVDEYAFFAQDQWRATDRLTLNYGIRYDLFRYAAGSIRNADPGLTGLGLLNDRINTDSNNISPRLGFAYKLTDWAAMRGGVGRYIGRTSSIVTGTSHTNNGLQIFQFTLQPGAPGFPTFPNLLTSVPPGVTFRPNVFVMSPDYQQPETWQWSYNLEFRVAPETSVTFGYLGVRGLRLPRSRDINVAGAELLTGTAVDLSGAANAIQYYRRPAARPNPNFGRITVAESTANSIYHGGFVQVQKRYSRNVQFMASYTWSKVIDDNPSPVAVVPDTGDDAAIVQDTLYTRGDRGVGDADVPHRFVGSAVWDIAYGNGLNPALRAVLGDWQLSLIGEASSGSPYTLRVGQDVNNDGNPRNDRVPGLGRNTERLPMFATLDTRVSKFIPLGFERMRLQLIGEAFNLTNRTNITGVQSGQFNFNAAAGTFTRAGNFLFASSSGAPRTIQLALRLSW